ncbi:MAG: hypothetical protein JWQ38_3376, partial [Flavipsychrobacter sp.]|nr:hypothetical protein [Flavipsychrobacter sp.]
LFYIYDVNSTTKLKDSIIIIDEPEIHLHPSAQIELINKLINIVKDKGQLWLATHSINILSHLDYESILLVSNNTVYPPSRKNPSKVFDELIDMSSHVDEFTNFVSARNDWHYANYIKECFLNPEVVNTLNIEDPQYLLLNEKLRVGRIEMLDFGAGVGRIGQIIHEDNLSDKVRYNAYEIDPERANQIRTTGVAKNVFTNITEITANNYDFIVVCNVFHEINPKEWLTNINAIKTALKDDGFLLILEDLELVRGENAHEFGYIILGIEELEILFENEKLITTRPSNDDRLSDRLYLCAVNKIDISVTETSITNAIKALNNKTIKKIQLIRESLNEDDARKYAFYSQLFINSTLYLNYVSKKKYEDLLK